MNEILSPYTYMVKAFKMDPKMENNINGRRNHGLKGALHPFESITGAVRHEAVKGDPGVTEPRGSQIGSSGVEFGGHRLHNNGTGWYTFSPSPGKRFIKQSYKVSPDFITGIHSRIAILNSAGSFEVAFHNFTGSTITITLQAVETDF